MCGQRYTLNWRRLNNMTRAHMKKKKNDQLSNQLNIVRHTILINIHHLNKFYALSRYVFYKSGFIDTHMFLLTIPPYLLLCANLCCLIVAELNILLMIVCTYNIDKELLTLTYSQHRMMLKHF